MRTNQRLIIEQLELQALALYGLTTKFEEDIALEEDEELERKAYPFKQALHDARISVLDAIETLKPYKEGV